VTATGVLHHVELWVPSIERCERSWGWLLGRLGYAEYQRFTGGVSWRLGETYLVFEESPALIGSTHERLRPGMNHLAFHVPDRAFVDELVRDAAAHGWRLMFADRHPFAGGAEHYAAYLEDGDGYEVELVAGALVSGP
jgi:catechol 2,3-dioxygenase-like lactoylglutathione lyase family enzyme